MWCGAGLAAMAVAARLVSGLWDGRALGAAVVTLLVMMVSTRLHREAGRRLLPPESQGFLDLAGNVVRILIGVIAALIVRRGGFANFPAFLTSLLVGYVIYLSAIILNLMRETE